MSDLYSGRRPIIPVALLLVATLAATMPASSAQAADEPLHENYDLVGSDLDAVIIMLESSIWYSERALMCLYNQTMDLAEQNLSAVRSILLPAQKVLEEIEDVASSYDSLSALIPPFAELSGLLDSFADDELTLLDARAEVVHASTLQNLTGDDLLEALEAIKKFNTLILRMNTTIDDMIVVALDIGSLFVEGDQPFADNQLIPLIEKLRDLLTTLEKELSSMVQSELPWQETGPFLVVWTSSDSYYLGDTILGGGYLFFEGAFQPGYEVSVILADSQLARVTTSAGGQFSFAYRIPVDISWLGTHPLFAWCETPIGTLTSETLLISISLIPTVICLRLSQDEISMTEDVTASVTLRDFRDRPIESDAGRFTVDGSDSPLQTGSDGNASIVLGASRLGYGEHSIRAVFDGEVPYAPSSSATLVVTVNIPTSLNISLASTEVLIGQYIVGNGTLFANGTDRLGNERVTLFLDGTIVANLTTGSDGGFAFTLPSADLAAGGHILKAAYLDREVIYRYCQDEKGFVLKGFKEGGYPFWPILPGLRFSPGDTITYLFIGKNAYFFWLLLLTFVGVAVRVIQMRKGAAPTEARKFEELEPIDSALRESGETPAPLEGPFEMPLPTEGPQNPNDRIVWLYQRLLALLIKRGRPGLGTSMTHREVARIMRAWGYPEKSVEDATMLFERALYSGANMTDEDAVHMSAAMTSLVRPRGKGAQNAV